jgi:hypothetical protein
MVVNSIHKTDSMRPGGDRDLHKKSKQRVKAAMASSV